MNGKPLLWRCFLVRPRLLLWRAAVVVALPSVLPFLSTRRSRGPALVLSLWLALPPCLRVQTFRRWFGRSSLAAATS